MTIGAHTIFRYFYYGDLLPNTYYLKLTGVSLIERISRGWQVFNNLVQKRLYTLLIPIILYISLSINKKINKRFFLLVILFCGISSYSIYVGGDAWEWMPYPNRYITIGMPLLILAACFSVYKINSHPNRLIILMALILLIIICYWLSALKIFYFFVPFIFVLALLYNFYEKKQKKLPMLSIKASPVLPFLIFILIGYLVNNVAYRHWVSYNAIHVYDDMNMTFLGCSISLNTTSDTKIAVNWAGAVPYFSNRYSIDLSGKMDKWIAKSKPATKKFWPGHNKWNYTYSIETYHPDIFVEYEPKHLPEYGYKYLENRGYEMFANDFYINKNSIAKFNKNFLANPFHYKWISLQQ